RVVATLDACRFAPGFRPSSTASRCRKQVLPDSTPILPTSAVGCATSTRPAVVRKKLSRRLHELCLDERAAPFLQHVRGPREEAYPARPHLRSHARHG